MPPRVSPSEREYLAALGAEIRVAREEDGLTIRDLADLTDLDKMTIHGIEHGSWNPSLCQIVRVVRALGGGVAIRWRVGRHGGR